MAEQEPRFCSHCGTAWSSGARFCAQCGASSAAVAHAPSPSPSAPTPPPASAKGADQAAEVAEVAAEDVITWQIEVPVLGNRFLRGSLLKGCLFTAGLAAVILGGIIGFASGKADIALLAGASAAGGTLVLFGLGTIGFFLIVGFSQPIAYRVCDEGVVMLNASRAAKGVHRAALIAGFLSGNAAAISAGAAAEAGEQRACSWPNVRRVDDYPGERILVLSGGLLSTIHVFCTPENYQQIRNFVMARTNEAKQS